MELGQTTQNLCNCISRTLTKIIIGTLRICLDNRGRELTIVGICTMTYYKCPKTLSVNADLWAWGNAYGSITQGHCRCFLAGHSGKCNLPQPRARLGLHLTGKVTCIQGIIIILLSWFQLYMPRKNIYKATYLCYINITPILSNHIRATWSYRRCVVAEWSACVCPLSLGSSHRGIVKLPQWFFFFIYDWSVLHFDWYILKFWNSLCQGMSLLPSTDGRRLELPRTVELCHFTWGNPITASRAHVYQSLLEFLQRWGVHRLWAPVFFYLLIKNTYSWYF